MPPPRDDDPLEWKLHTISSALFPSSLEDYGTEYVRNVLRAVVTIDDTEVATEFTVQKFCFELRAANLRLFAPFSIYLGGRYSTLTSQVLELAVDEDILQLRPSTHSKLDVDVFELSPSFADAVKNPPEWDEIYAEFCDRFNLVNFFDAHDRTQIYPWITDPENYLGFDRNLFEKARNGDLDIDVELVADEVSYLTPLRIAKTDRVYRPFVATAYHLTNEYKYIPSAETRAADSGHFQYVKRKFSVEAIQEAATEDADELAGELVFLVGFPDLGEGPIDSPGTWHLRETPADEQTIEVEFTGRLDIDPHDLAERSLGVLGYLDTRGGRPLVKAFALLDSGELPQALIDEQRGQVSARLDRQVAQVADSTDRMADNLEAVIEHLTDEQQQTKVRRLQKQLRDAVDDAQRVKVLYQFIEDNPELGWIAKKVLTYINI